MPTLQRPLLLALVLLALVPFGGAASAETEPLGSQRVAIAHLEFDGKVPEGLQQLFAERLVQGLAAARFEVLPGPDVKQRLAHADPGLVACRNADCYPAMASALAASYLITAHVSESNKTYTMVMEIINGRTGAVLASNRDRCETCGAEEAGEKMGLAASALRERLEMEARAPARLVIRSRPPGATVVMDGKSAGTTPLDTNLAGGSHHMQLTMPDHEMVVRSFTVVAGVDESMDLDLAAIPSRFPYRTAGWSAVGGGAALLIAGIITMGYDHHQVSCSLAQSDGFGNCPNVWNTRWWAATMMGVGIAAATVGATMLYLAPAPGPSGAMAVVASRF